MTLLKKVSIFAGTISVALIFLALLLPYFVGDRHKGAALQGKFALFSIYRECLEAIGSNQPSQLGDLHTIKLMSGRDFRTSEGTQIVDVATDNPPNLSQPCIEAHLKGDPANNYPEFQLNFEKAEASCFTDGSNYWVELCDDLFKNKVRY